MVRMNPVLTLARFKANFLLSIGRKEFPKSIILFVIYSHHWYNNKLLFVSHSNME